MTGLTKHGTCKPSCTWKEIGSCSHPDYTKTVRELRKCPLDPRTSKQIRQDVTDRRIYFKRKEELELIEKQLEVLTMGEISRKKHIKKLNKKREQLNLLVRTYESNYKP